VSENPFITLLTPPIFHEASQRQREGEQGRQHYFQFAMTASERGEIVVLIAGFISFFTLL
jgi:hypothetical protein